MVLIFYWIAWGLISAVIGGLVFLLVFVLMFAGGFFSIGFLFIFWILVLAGWLTLLVFCLVGIIQSLTGKYWKCPLGVNALARKFKF